MSRFSLNFNLNLCNTIEAMEGRTTTVVRITSAIKKTPYGVFFKNLGRGGFEPPYPLGNRFTVCRLQPLGHLPLFFFQNLPLTRFELVASPLPRECATPAPQRHDQRFFSAAPSWECYLSQNDTQSFCSAESLRHKGMINMFQSTESLCHKSLLQPRLFFYQRKKPVIGIEPTTYGLQNRCSTVELYRQQNLYYRKQILLSIFYF